jgi:hypothetical protein
VADPPAPEEPGAPEVIVDADGRRAAEQAVARGDGVRTAVWVGAEGEPALEEFRAEIGRRR